MSTITTLSKFYYNFNVTASTVALDFADGGPEINANLTVGIYTASQLAAHVQAVLIAASGNANFRCSFDYATGKFTIYKTSGGNFELLWYTGYYAGFGSTTSSRVLLGYDQTNLSGAITYTAQNTGGSSYEPQYILADYVAAEHNIVKENASVNQTAVGYVRQVSFGDGARIEMNIRIITNKVGLTNTNFINDAAGVSKFLSFMAYLLTKNPVEFLPNKASSAVVHKCYLESTKEDKDARKFQLKNMKVPDFYESGVLVFRKVLI